MFFVHLFHILKKKWRNVLAKPRRIKLESGTVLLSGFPKEIANELENHILKFKMPEPSACSSTTKVEEQNEVKVEQKQEEAEEQVKLHNNKAIGLYEKSPGQFEVVVVGYDCELNEANIEEVKNAGDFKQHAISVYQQEIFKRGIV